ncbi:MAG TPA: sulfotransferase, partial [Myxococcota bacterium]|nr:sulfotransferase [Myxococcota bacterium]
AALRAIGLDRAVPLDPDRLVAHARRQEGLTDLGEPGLEPLRRLVDAIEAEADLHPFGRFATATRLVQALRNRLRAQAMWTADPSILARPLPRPIVITGLQRTGTTALHRLLAADPRLRALRSWEALNPAPLPARPGRPDPRVASAVQAERALRWLSPDFFAVHPVEAQAPEEEVLLLDHAFLSTVAEATLRVPSFSAWLEAQDQAPAYAMLRRMLQLLTAQRGPDRWVLKTPHHLEWLDDLAAALPDAVVVMTHRDPLVTLPSFCSMIAHGRGVMSDRVDPHEIGRDWLRKVGRMMDRAMAARAGLRVVDVQYREIVDDPHAAVRRICEAADLDPPGPAEIAARAAAMPKDRHGIHRYELQDFGLSADEVAERFKEYRAAFVGADR